MKSWRESDPAASAGSDAPLSLRHILGAPPADTWWGLHRTTLVSVTGWVTSLAVVVSAGYLLWAMMYRDASDHDPFLGLPRPRATSTTAPPVGDRPADVADVVKVVRPEPLTVATTASGVEAKSTTIASGGGTGASGGGTGASGGGSGASGGPSGSNSGSGGPASPTTEAPRAGGTTTSDDSGGNRGQGGASTASSTTTTQPTGSASSSSWSSSTTRVTSSTSTASTVDDKGGGSGSGGGGSGSGSGGGPGKG